MERSVVAPILRELGNRVGHGEDLVGVLVEEQMVIRKCRPLMCQWKFFVFR